MLSDKAFCHALPVLVNHNQHKGYIQDTIFNGATGMKDKFDIISIVILMITVIILLFALASSEPIKQGEGIMRHNGFHSWNEYEHTKHLLS